MDPITRRNNSEIQQLRMGPPMKIRAQLVIGRWLAGSPTCQVLEPPSLSPILARYLHCLCARPPRALYVHIVQLHQPHIRMIRS